MWRVTLRAGDGTVKVRAARFVVSAVGSLNVPRLPAMEAIRETLASGARSCEVLAEAHDDYAARYQAEISQLVWSHPSIRHSHYKNSAGKVFTLSPWPIDLYWEWTRRVNRGDYVFG